MFFFNKGNLSSYIFEADDWIDVKYQVADI